MFRWAIRISAVPGAASVVFILISFAGIIRHDVPKADYMALARQPQFDCVGRVVAVSGMGGGSCVLIGSKYVLTAAHLFVESDFRPDTMEYQGKTIVNFQPVNDRFGDIGGYQFFFRGKPYKAVRCTVHPTYTLDNQQNGIDLAVVELAEAVPDVRPVPLHTVSDELGKTVVGVGYGGFALANKPEDLDTSYFKIAGQNTIDSLGGEKPKGMIQWPLLIADFDRPGDTDSCNRIGSPEPLPLEYIVTGGDSGGGLFMHDGSKWTLAGICSGNDLEIERFMKFGYYGQLGMWTRVSVFADWIRSQMGNK